MRLLNHNFSMVGSVEHDLRLSLLSHIQYSIDFWTREILNQTLQIRSLTSTLTLLLLTLSAKKDLILTQYLGTLIVSFIHMHRHTEREGVSKRERLNFWAVIFWCLCGVCGRTYTRKGQCKVKMLASKLWDLHGDCNVC